MATTCGQTLQRLIRVLTDEELKLVTGGEQECANQFSHSKNGNPVFFANSDLTTQNEDIIIKTRGGGGLNGGNNSPLYVVDGIPLDIDPKLKS